MPPIRPRPLRPIPPMPPGIEALTPDQLAAAYAQLTPDQQVQATWVATSVLQSFQQGPPAPGTPPSAPPEEKL